MIEISQYNKLTFYNYSTASIRSFILNLHQSLLTLMVESIENITVNTYNSFDKNSRNMALIYFVFIGVYVALTIAQYLFGYSLAKVTNKSEELLLSISARDCAKLQAEAKDFLATLRVHLNLYCRMKVMVRLMMV